MHPNELGQAACAFRVLSGCLTGLRSGSADRFTGMGVTAVAEGLHQLVKQSFSSVDPCFRFGIPKGRQAYAQQVEAAEAIVKKQVHGLILKLAAKVGKSKEVNPATGAKIRSGCSNNLITNV